MARHLDIRNGGICPRCGRTAPSLREIQRRLAGSAESGARRAAEVHPDPDAARARLLFVGGWLEGEVRQAAADLSHFTRSCRDGSDG